VNRRPRGALTAEMLAYVDNCLPQRERLTFESRMAGDPEIKSQVAQWLFQNQAIRAAFRDPPDKPVPIPARGPAAKRPAADWAPQSIRILRESKALERRLAAANRTAEAPRKVDAAPVRRMNGAKKHRPGAARRVFYTLAATLALWTAGPFVVPDGQSTAFVAAGAAAYRAFAQSTTRPVEIATADRGIMNSWIAPRIGRVLPVPDLSGAGLILLAARIVPGAASPASFALYEDSQRERIGLYVEALDSPPAARVEVKVCGDMLCASWTAAGYGFALVGRLSRARMIELARLIGDSQLKI
jgi:anti-sigma factor RsiW